MTDTTVGAATGAAMSHGPRDAVDVRRQRGRGLRKEVPRSSHAEWTPAAGRPGPVALLEEQNATRVPWLVPVRRGRMAVSAFTFYRGAARVMSTDLATTPSTGLTVQACGDAHLSYFGAYASPERVLVFDVNDFDETLPGPWEWDLKRLATSVVVAGRDRGFDDTDSRAAARTAVASYRKAMASFAGRTMLDIWYASLPVARITKIGRFSRRGAERVERFEERAKSKDSLQALATLTEKVDGQYRIRRDPPVLVPLRDLPFAAEPDALATIIDAFATYRASLPDHRRHLLDRFTPVDMALKVVGVGSVGTRCLIVLLDGRDEDDPLFLQIKEASASVLEEHLPSSVYDHHGKRVVQGQHLMQSASDIFLGWARRHGGRDYYLRQLKDWKGSVDVDGMSPTQLARYARLCAWTLARAHARTGDPIAIAGYLGTGDVAIEAFTDFAVAYADQNERDYAAFRAAIDDGILTSEDD